MLAWYTIYMTERNDIHLVGFVGMPGAGKTEAVQYLVNKDWPKIYLGGLMYAEMDKAGVEITPLSQQIFREQLRAEHGKDFLAQLALQQVERLINAGQKNIVVDGIYSWSEFKVFKHQYHSELNIIAIVAPRHLRHHRLANRPERPFTENEAMHRDYTEIENMEKGGPIAIADHYIVNDSDIDTLHKKIDDIMQHETFAE